MKKKEHARFTGVHLHFAIASTIFLLCAVVSFACFRYYTKLQETVKAETGGYLQEISKQIGANTSNAIEDNFTLLATAAMVLKNSGISNFAQLDTIMEEQQQHWIFKHILLVDHHGVAYDTHGNSSLLESAPYLQEAIVARKRSMSTSQMMGNTECVVFALPLDGLTLNGTEIAALIGTYDLSTFDRILSMTAFDGKGYGYIIRRDGTVVIPSSSPFAPKTGYNLLSSLMNASFAGIEKANTIVSNIANGKTGQAELTMDGVSLYMAYTPLKTQEWYLLTFVPVAVANAKSILLLRMTALLCALITLIFCTLLITLGLSTYRHKHKLEQIAYIDPITGGNTIQRFYVQVAELLAHPNLPQYALIYTNISKFKVLNEQLGRAVCDIILTTLSKSIQKDLDSHECLGRLFADNFCILLCYKGEEDLTRRLNIWDENYNASLQENNIVWLPLNMEIGVYILEDLTLPLPDMVDRAKLALREAHHDPDASVHYKIYDERVRKGLLREKQLEDMMKKALEQSEFQVYLQPKYLTNSECIGGAEALARWNSPTEGMIYPDEFISLFEKNGFIIQLDLWVFEQVCQTLRNWLDMGYHPMRISVNCSRIHLKVPNFLNQYKKITERYAIPPKLLEIELTENVVFSDVKQLTGIISEIHALGFSCSMDDFGSGYSSLNLIQDIPVDVLKLDKIFFRSGAENLDRTESVVRSILAMAKDLSMETVAEGVEEKAQVEMLKNLGCDYIQGYYFARPMPISQFQALAFGKVVI